MEQFTLDYITDLNSALGKIHPSLLLQIANKITETKNNGGYIFLIGNGGSSATPSHSAGDWTKELGIKAICLSDNIPLLTAYANDTDYSNIFLGPLKTLLTSNDLLLAYSGSGNSPNIINAVEYAKALGIFTIGFTGNYKLKVGGQLAKIADITLVVDTTSMERIEDAHLIINHILKEYLKSRL